MIPPAPIVLSSIKYLMYGDYFWQTPPPTMRDKGTYIEGSWCVLLWVGDCYSNYPLLRKMIYTRRKFTIFSCLLNVFLLVFVDTLKTTKTFNGQNVEKQIYFILLNLLSVQSKYCLLLGNLTKCVYQNPFKIYHCNKLCAIWETP